MDSLQSLTNGEVLSLATVLLLAISGALWRTASLRGDTHSKWRQRVELAEAGLSENAAKELRSLFLQITELLGTGSEFDPRRVVADPGALVASAARFRRLIQTRDRLKRRFELLLRLGPIFFVSLLALAVGLVLGFGQLLGIIAGQWVCWAAVGVTTVSLVVIVIGFAAYVVVQQWLSGAEILSVPEESDE